MPRIDEKLQSLVSEAGPDHAVVAGHRLMRPSGMSSNDWQEVWGTPNGPWVEERGPPAPGPAAAREAALEAEMRAAYEKHDVMRLVQLLGETVRVAGDTAVEAAKASRELTRMDREEAFVYGYLAAAGVGAPTSGLEPHPRSFEVSASKAAAAVTAMVCREWEKDPRCPGVGGVTEDIALQAGKVFHYQHDGKAYYVEVSVQCVPGTEPPPKEEMN